MLLPSWASNLDSNNWVLSLPSACPDALNLKAPTAEVVPNPTIFDLILTSFGSLFVKFNDKTPPDNDAPNVPIKLLLNDPWLLSKNDCDIKVVSPVAEQIPTKVSTKFISLVTKSVTWELTKRLFDVVTGVDIIDDTVPAASVVLATLTTDPVKVTKPKVLDPVPVKVELNLDCVSLIS